MAIPTTTIGAYPKPDYVPVGDWSTVEDGMSSANATRRYTETMTDAGEQVERLFVRAAGAVIGAQIAAA